MKKIFLIFVGTLALVLGTIGIFLPILPTTPFVLLAATCFGSSSPRLYHKLKNTKYFGQYIDHYNNGTGVPKAVKIKSLVFLWPMLLLSAYLIRTPLMCLILALVGIGVTIHILLLKPKIPTEKES